MTGGGGGRGGGSGDYFSRLGLSMGNGKF